MAHNKLNLFAVVMFLFGFIAISPVQASEGASDFTPNRPGAADPAHVLAPGLFQVEVGYIYKADEHSGTDTTIQEFPETVFLFGVAKGFELKFEVFGHEYENEDGHAQEDGFKDGALAAKFALWHGHGMLPDAAFEVGTTLPFGEREHFSSGRADPFLFFAFHNALTDHIGLTYNLGSSWETEEDSNDDRHTRGHFNYALAVDYQASGGWGLFGEIFGEEAYSKKGEGKHFAGGGITYLVGHNMQLDAFIGFGLNETAEDTVAGAGFTILFGN